MIFLFTRIAKKHKLSILNKILSLSAIIIVGIFIVISIFNRLYIPSNNSQTKGNMNPIIVIGKENISIKNSIDYFPYTNYEVIINDIFSARFLRKPDITRGDSIEVPYSLFDLPVGSVIKSLIFRMPNFNDFIIVKEIESHGELLDFLGIQWGSNIQTSRVNLEQRGYTEIRIMDRSLLTGVDNIDRHRELYTDHVEITARGDFAGFNYSRITLTFFQEKFYHAIVEISLNYDNRIITPFNRLYNLLSERYWDTIVSTREIYPTYAWLFDNNCTIKLTDTSSSTRFSVNIEYYENKIFNEREIIRKEYWNRIEQETEKRILDDL